MPPRRRRGETLVDLQHLLEDLRDAYSGAVEETILTELVANSLDAGASRIQFFVDAARSALVVVDDGRGMQWKQLRDFHNLATSSKVRGEGIGFAGVGVKLALLVCREVITESRRGKSHVATRWHLASRHRAPYELLPPPGHAGARGTAVRLNLENPLSPLLDAGYIEHALRTHYQPLLDPAFDGPLRELYPAGVGFEINGIRLGARACDAPEIAGLEVRIGRQRKPSGFGYLARAPISLAEHRRGLAISTFGKVIRQGWDWLGVFPSDPGRVTGILEVPALAGCLTLNKGDFVRSGTRGAAYLAYRRAIQQVVQRQLSVWGDASPIAEDARRRAARPVERDLERVLVELAGEFPLLSSLVEHRSGGQKKLPLMGSGGSSPASASEPASVSVSDPSSDPLDAIAETRTPDSAVATLAPPEISGRPGPHGVPDPTVPATRKPGRYGLTIEYEDRPGSLELGRLVESAVVVNSTHPAYSRAVQSSSVGYHLALTVALALAPLAVAAAGEHAFVTAFLSKWGEAVKPAKRRRA